MYSAEVLGKLPVMQHFFFGSILVYDGPPPPSSDEAGADAHHGHAHPHATGVPGAPVDRDMGWGDCCGIPVPSAFAAARAETTKQPGLRLAGPGIRPVPFD